MNILIYSRPFSPNVGGLETMMALLAEEFVSAGHAVKVVTLTQGAPAPKHLGYEIHRRPNALAFIHLARWSDVCLSANVSLRGLAPILLAHRPIVFSHQNVYDLGMASHLKRIVARASTNICCSGFVQSKTPGKSTVIPNSYRGEFFKIYNDVEQSMDIVFVGRLVSDKGVADLIDALRLLRDANYRPRLSIVGDGPEKENIDQRIRRFGLETQVTFAGMKSGTDLARFIGRHRVMAVPSRWAEPFGIVALEGIACGCVVVGTQLGGLAEAIGACGTVVPNGDSDALAKALRSILDDESVRLHYRSFATEHLAAHSRPVIARRYLEVLQAAVGETRSLG
jgi:glycogen synthase